VAWFRSGSSRSKVRNARTAAPYWRRLPASFWLPILCGIGILLVILGALNYRWGLQIKRAAEMQVGADLESAMIKWHLDFYGEFSTVCVALQIGPDSGERDSWEDYLHRYTRWGRATTSENSADQLYANRDLVKEIYIWETSRRSDPKLLRLNAEKEVIENAAVPDSLDPLLNHLNRNSSNLQMALRAWEADAATNEARSAREEPASTSHSLRSNAETGWQFDEGIPALVHPIFHYPRHAAVDTKALSSMEPVDWVVVVLNLETIQKRILPGLMQRYFRGNQGLEYKLAVIAEGTDPRVLYSSDPGFGVRIEGKSDSVMNIFGPPGEGDTGDLWNAEKKATSLIGEDWHRFSSPVWFPIIQRTAENGPWLLVLQSRAGPLDAPVTRVWRANLLTGGVILLLLAASMVLVVVASQRAQTLANLQMDFVASVSHELRTPLAVILSAGENVQDGLPNEPKQFMEQGAIITEQAHQLMELVDQVLRFAVSAKKGTVYHSPRPLQVRELVESALRTTSDSLHEEGFTVEQHIPADLPSTIGDLPVLSQCLQNLIINAVKYSDKHRWIGITARKAENANEIEISVADHGIGIHGSELALIFEPFYRSPQGIAAQIRGTGLGLSIAKRNAEAFGGRLSVISEVGAGSVFTLHLPVFEEDPNLTLVVPEAKTRSPQ
jgi:signal transduction histidine kinase